MGPLACTTCRLIRRFVLAFGLGGLLAWQMTGTLPFEAQSTATWQGITGVAVMFTFLNVVVRMREMRSRFRRRGN